MCCWVVEREENQRYPLETGSLWAVEYMEIIHTSVYESNNQCWAGDTWTPTSGISIHEYKRPESAVTGVRRVRSGRKK